MRFISPDMFLDEWFGCLDPIQRLLWIGLLTSCADDQGRFINNPVLIRVRIFPYDPAITKEQIQGHLTYFKESHKIICLQFGQNGATKECMQIANWWKYQKHTHWAAPSELPAPDGWTDRVRSHLPGHGTKPVAQNWDQAGGFHTVTQSLRSDNVETTKPQRSREDEEEFESDVEDKDKKEDESSSVLEDSPASTDPTMTTTACLTIFHALGATPVQTTYLEQTSGIQPADIWAMAAQVWRNPKVRKPAWITLQNILSGERASAEWYDPDTWSSIPEPVRIAGGLVIQGQEKNENNCDTVATRNSKETEAGRIWQQVCEQLERDEPHGKLVMYLQGAWPIGLEKDRLQVLTANISIHKWLEERATKIINRLLAGITNQTTTVEFILQEETTP